jgi:hypothetical protein
MTVKIEVKEPRNVMTITAVRETSMGTEYERQLAFCDLTNAEQNKLIDTLELASIKLRQLRDL